MKKLILSTVTAFVAGTSSLSSIAMSGPFSQLRKNTVNPLYQNLWPTSDPDFCHCFMDALLTGMLTCAYTSYILCIPGGYDKKEIDAMHT